MGYDTANEWAALQGICNAILQARAELERVLLAEDQH